MRLFKSFLVALTVVLAAGSAGALVTVNHTAVLAPGQNLNNIAIGENVTIQVRVTWDGAPGLFGIFQSTAATGTGSMVGVSAVNGANLYRPSLFAFTDDETGSSTSLSRFGQSLRTAVDGENVIRSIQYGSVDPISGSGATSNTLVTTLVFRATGAGNVNIGTFLALADNGVQGNAAGAGSSVNLTVIPEPGTALLMGLGLAGLGLAGRRS